MKYKTNKELANIVSNSLNFSLPWDTQKEAQEALDELVRRARHSQLIDEVDLFLKEP